MKYLWKKRIELDIGTAMPVDPQPMPMKGRRKYQRCPLCLEHCSEAYWNRYHGKQLHGQCPFCQQWFLLPSGLGMHLSRSQCGFLILETFETSGITTFREVIIRIKKAP